MRILVLGHRGMLGHMVHKFFSDAGYEVVTIGSRWPSESFQNAVKESGVEYVINCIASIPQKSTIFSINYDLPKWLNENTEFKIIHPGSDIENGTPYCQSKGSATDYILKEAKRTKIIRTSVIGPELESSHSILSWFLSHPDEDEVSGFVDIFWNGVTTLTWAKYAKEIIENWDLSPKITLLESECISKFNLLEIFNGVYSRKIKISPISSVSINNCLGGGIKTGTIKSQLEELIKYNKDESRKSI